MAVKKQTTITFVIEYDYKRFRALQAICQEWKENAPMFRPQSSTGPAYQTTALETGMAEVANEILQEGAATR